MNIELTNEDRDICKRGDVAGDIDGICDRMRVNDSHDADLMCILEQMRTTARESRAFRHNRLAFVAV